MTVVSRDTMNRSRVSTVGVTLLLGLLSTHAGAEAPADTAAGVTTGDLKLMDIQLTAFGDFRYRFAKGHHDRFEIGSVELDSALKLSPHVTASAAIAYDPEGGSFGLPAFTVDGSLFGPEEKHLIKADWLDDSGVIFGKFDVPFGIAYLEYPATENRFVTSPDAVMLTHGGWNDIGVQAYLTAPLFEVTMYLVNGNALEDESAAAAGKSAQHAFGGRLGLKPIEGVSLGGSIAQALGSLDTPLYGADLSAEAGPFQLKNEYIRRSSAGAPVLHGFYTEAMAHVSMVFAGARYETTLSGPEISDRGLALTLGAEVFPQAEVRIAHVRTLDSGAETTFIQLVGGSIWQPTGLRR